MRVLVTGGAGFIGSHLVPALLERGYAVTVFDLAAEPATLAAFRERIDYVRGDLASAADLYRAMMTCRPEGVFHLGAILAGPCEENPVRGFQVNFGSTQALLDACVAQRARKFFMVSSISVFGRDVPEPVADHAVKNPETVYGQTKLASEHLLQWYARKHGLDTRALRFTWVFGPGRTTGITALYSSLILDAIARGEPVSIPNPEERGDWLYVKDAVKAILKVWDAGEPAAARIQYRRRRALHPRGRRDRAEVAPRRARHATTRAAGRSRPTPSPTTTAPPVPSSAGPPTTPSRPRWPSTCGSSRPADRHATTKGDSDAGSAAGLRRRPDAGGASRFRHGRALRPDLHRPAGSRTRSRPPGRRWRRRWGCHRSGSSPGLARRSSSAFPTGSRAGPVPSATGAWPSR